MKQMWLFLKVVLCYRVVAYWILCDYFLHFISGAGVFWQPKHSASYDQRRHCDTLRYSAERNCWHVETFIRRSAC